MKILFALFLTAAFALAQSPQGTHSQQDQNKAIEEIVCPDQFTARYESPATLSFDSKIPAPARRAFQKAIDDFNSLVPGQVSVVSDDNPKANIVVSFSWNNPLVMVDWAAVKLDTNRSGIKHSTISWTLIPAYNLTANTYDKGTFDFVYHGALKRLLRAVGVGPDHKKASSLTGSIWSLSGDADTPLTVLDQTAIKLLYEKLPSGTPVTKVKQIVRKESEVKK